MEFDSLATHWLNSLAGQSALADGVMIFLARFAIFVVVGSIALRWWARSGRDSQRFIALSCGLATAIGLGFNQAILLFIDRIRPYDQGITQAIIDKSADPSFPSDHATVVFATAILLLLKRDRFWPAYMAVAVLVGTSRVFVGLHFVSDVLGGAATAALAAGLVHMLFRRESALSRRLTNIF